MPKQIELTRGVVTTVDDDDYAELAARGWHACGAAVIYAARWQSRARGRQKILLMHREIMGAKAGECVDHIDGDTLNNRRSNLRLCSHAENMCNRKLQKNNKTGVPGLYFDRRRNGWRVFVQKNGKVTSRGPIRSRARAIQVRNELAKLLHGEFARTHSDGAA